MILTGAWARLCGFSPFVPENENSGLVYSRVEKGTFEFPEDVPLTREARHLIKSLLTVDPTRRITASDALKHPWVTQK
jgi:serine/threonine protein kinase